MVQEQVKLLDVFFEMVGELDTGLPLIVEKRDGDIHLYVYTYNEEEGHYRRANAARLWTEDGHVVADSQYVVPSDPAKGYIKFFDVGDPEMEEKIVEAMKEIYEQVDFFLDIYGVEIVKKPSKRLIEWLHPGSGNDVITKDMLAVSPSEWGSV